MLGLLAPIGQDCLEVTVVASKNSANNERLAFVLCLQCYRSALAEYFIAELRWESEAGSQRLNDGCLAAAVLGEDERSPPSKFEQRAFPAILSEWLNFE